MKERHKRLNTSKETRDKWGWMIIHMLLEKLFDLTLLLSIGLFCLISSWIFITVYLLGHLKLFRFIANRRSRWSISLVVFIFGWYIYSGNIHISAFLKGEKQRKNIMNASTVCRPVWPMSFSYELFIYSAYMDWHTGTILGKT